MISEVDIRDWDFDKAQKMLQKVAAYHDCHKDILYLQDFILQVQELVKGKQPQVAALFQPIKGYAPQRGEGTE
jgi:hypothetical protein